MAAESDFDIDEVLDWDKRDYPSKDLEFQELTGLDLPSEVTAPSQSTSQAAPSSAQENLVLANQLLQQQRNAVSLPSQKQGTTIVRMPQMPNSSGLLDPVFPVGGPMISDIRQELMHSHALGRSGTPPTPTFPSENFDLPPLTPPASTGSMSAAFQSLGHSAISARMTSHLMTSAEPGTRPAAPRVMPSFGQTNLVQMPQHRPTIPSSIASMPLTQPLSTSNEAMEEGSIEKLLDEIVERDMPQGVDEAIVFPSEVPEHSTASSTQALQVNAQRMPAKPLQPATMVPKTVTSTGMVHRAPMHMAASPQSPASIGLMNSPLNQNPASPVAPARTPSPNVQVHQKANIQLRQSTPQMSVSSSLGLAQPAFNTVRTSTGQPTSSQMTQQPSNQASDRLSPAMQSAQMSAPNRSPQNVPQLSSQANLQAGTSPANTSKVNWSSQNMAQMLSQAKLQTSTSGSSAGNVNLKLIQGGSVLPIRIQGNAQSLQGLKLGPAINNPAVLQQIMKAVAPSGAGTPVKSTQATTAATTQANQRLIYYVMPQKNTSGGTTVTQAGQGAAAAASPVKMFLINADKSLLSKSQPKPAQAVSTPGPTRIQLPLGMTTQTALPKENPSTQPAQLDAKDNLSNSQQIQEQQPSGQQVSITAPTPLQNMLQKAQLAQSVASSGIHSKTSSSVAATATDLSMGMSVAPTVPITFINEATIGRVVACTPTVTTVYAVSTAQSSTTVVATSTTKVTPSAVSNSQVSVKYEESDEDDDDSRPLAQVAQNLKKTRKKGTKRKKKSKEGEETSKPHSAYQIFFKETQAAIRQQKPTAQFDEIAKIVSHMWEKLGEDQKKVYTNKARMEQQEGTKPERPQAAPTKQRKTDTASTTEPHRVAPGNSSPATQPTTEGPPSTTPKTMTTVLPAAKSKKESSLKSKKEKKTKSSINPISQRLCVRDGCSMPARTTKDRGTQYCSNECTVKHCSLVFKSWVEQRKAEAQAALRQTVS